MNELALFAGAGGGILGGKLLGWRTVCAVERDAYAAAVLAQRQNDGHLEPFPIWSDIETFDGRPWRGLVDVVSGGFPCQDISCAGKGAGIAGERSGLWDQMACVVREVRPRFVLVENSPMLTSRGLGVVLGDLAAMGFDAEWGVLGAFHAGAPHRRERIWIAAHSESNGRRSRRSWGSDSSGARESEQAFSVLADADSPRQGAVGRGWFCDEGQAGSIADARCQTVSDASLEGLPAPECETILRARRREAWRTTSKCGWWSVEPDVGRVAHGVANRVDRLKSIGNGQVPAVVALAWSQLV